MVLLDTRWRDRSSSALADQLSSVVYQNILSVQNTETFVRGHRAPYLKPWRKFQREMVVALGLICSLDPVLHMNGVRVAGCKPPQWHGNALLLPLADR